MNKFLYRTEGRFYLGDTSKQAQYVFQLREDAPKELQRSFLVKLEDDGNFSGSALEVAYDLDNVFSQYWISTAAPKVKALINYLEIWEEKDKYDALHEEQAKLQNRLFEIEKKLSGYDHEEMANWKPESPESTESA